MTCANPLANFRAMNESTGQGGSDGYVNRDVHCSKCGYSLKTLPLDGKCPECGASIEDSWRSSLHNASTPYLQKLRGGLSLVLNGILLQVILGVAGFLIGLAMPSAIGTLQPIFNVLGVAVAVMVLIGYFKYSDAEPDVKEPETIASQRSMLRGAIVVQMALTVVSLAIALIMNAGTATLPLMVASTIVGLVSLLAWIVGFIAMMNYTHWIASRIPDLDIQKRALRFRWLLPVISILGLLLLGLGPLIALVMYWNLLDQVRKHIKTIMASHDALRIGGKL